MKKVLLALLACIVTVASAQSTYDRSTVPPKSEFYVTAYGARCIGLSDGSDASGIQAAVTAAGVNGGTVHETGKCTINATISVPSNVTILRYGATMTPAAAGSWSGGVIKAAYSAANNATNVKILGGTLDWSAATGTTSIIVFPSGNSDFEVSGVTCKGGGDCVAMVGASYGRVHGNKETGTLNACWDMWGGANHNDVYDNQCATTTSSVSAYCILITGLNTDLSAAHTDFNKIHDNICELNGQAGSGQLGDWIEGHASGGSVSHGIIHDEHFIVASGIWAEPIRGTGIIDDWDVHDNNMKCDGVTTATLPLVEVNGSGPTHIYVHDNHASNCKAQTSGSDRGLFKNGGTGGSLRDNSCTGTCSSLVDYVGSAGTPQQLGDSVAGDASYTITSPTTFVGAIVGQSTLSIGDITSTSETSTGNLIAGSGSQIGWTGAGIVTSPGAATFQLGGSNSATPIDQLLKVQGARNGTDTDVGGGNLTIASGAGTGAGAVSGITLSTPNLGSTGTAVQSYGARLTLNQGTAEVASGSTIDWAGRGILTSPASGQIQLGNADAASPANQTLMTQNSRGGTDSNVAGGNLTIQSGLGTGNATGSSLTLKTPHVGSTGTTQETAVNVITATDAAIAIGNATSNPTITLLGSGVLSGTPITNLFASPPTTGSGTPNTGTFTQLVGTSGSVSGLTTLGIRDTSAAFDVTLAAVSSVALTAGRTLTFDLVNAARTLKLGSNLTIASDPGAVTGALKSNGSGTFGQAACSDLSNGATGCSTTVGTIATQNANNVAITGGTLAGLTGLAIRDTSAAFDVTLAGTSSTALTAGRTLTFDLKNVAHTLAFGSSANTITFPSTSSYTVIGSGDTGTVTNTMLATAATNTVKGNATSGTAADTDLAVGGCSAATSALNWTTNTGFGCNTSITASNLVDTTTGADQLAAGTTAQRPSTAAGKIRYNSDLGIMEYYNGGRSAWLPVGGTYVICNAHPAATHTGNQSESNLATCTIPANIMGTTGMLRITSIWTRTATGTNTVTYIVRHNTTSGAVTGGTTIQNPANASSGSVASGCMTTIRNSDATHQDGAGNTQNLCNFNSAYSAQTAGTIDTTAASYLNFNCTDTTSSSDTCGILWYTVELII